MTVPANLVKIQEVVMTWSMASIAPVLKVGLVKCVKELQKDAVPVLVDQAPVSK